jgi:ankyrin repeat protein
MFAAYYNNQESIELLGASDAKFEIIDAFGRSALHYAALNDN